MNEQNHTSSNHSDDEIDLLELIATILNGKWLILFFSVFTTILAFFYAFGTPPIYKADSLLQVELKKAGIPGIEDLTGLGGDDTSVGTELEIIKSRKILGKAVDNLNLDIVSRPKTIKFASNLYKKFLSNYDFQKPNFGWSKINNFSSQFSWSNDSITINRLQVPKHLLNQPLTLTTEKNGMFELSVKKKTLLKGKVGKLSQDSVYGIAIHINELKSLPSTKFELIKRSKLQAIEYLQRNLKVSEKGKKTGIISLRLEGENKETITNTLDFISNTYLQQNKLRSSEEASNALSFLEEQIKPVREKADVAEAKLKQYRTNNQTADMSMETQAVLQVISTIDTELQNLSLKRDELNQKYTENHPTIQSLSSQESQLKERKQETLSKISQLPETQQELLKLEGDYKVANTVYLDLLNNIQEFKIAKASTVGNVYIVDPAVVYDKPVKPKKALILALGALLGSMLGILIVFLRKALHRTVNNPEKLEEAIGIPVYATIPLSKEVKLTGGLKKDKKQKSLLALEKNTDPAIESLRSLRTSLHFALLEAKNNIVMVTGPAPGIGKSFISSNFAAIVSSTGQKVLLIDADMRKGYLHKLVNKKMTPGLSDLITGEAILQEAIHTIQVGEESLDIINRGKTPPNPSELLMHKEFEEILNTLSKKYDLIIIDTPPVHAVTDPTIIGKHAGVTFMVVRSDKHSMKEIEHATTRLSHSGVETKGFIFNGYVPKKNSGYGGYGYNSYYGDYKSDD